MQNRFPGLVNTYEDSGLGWRVDGTCDEMGSDGECSCALAPAVQMCVV